MQTNWAGNITFAAAEIATPTSVGQLQELVASATGTVRALGTGHSFNRIADSPDLMINVGSLPRRVEIDAAAGTVTVSAGLRYGEVVDELNQAGFALANLGSLPHISIAGACATGTHGSGPGNQILAGSVTALEFVRAEGSLDQIDRSSADFAGSIVHLGALGIVTAVTLDLIPSFQISQTVYDDLPLAALTESFDEIMSAGYSVSLFTDWQHDSVDQVWLKRLAGQPDPGADFYGAARATEPRHPVPGMAVEHCTQQLGIAGPWHERLPHFRLEFTPSNGDELQSEFLLPRRHAVAALAAVRELRELMPAVLQISEIRTIAADDLWLSASYQQDSVAFHFTWTSDYQAVRPVLAEVEKQLAPFGARPHWGKVFTTPPQELDALFPRLSDFRALMAKYDPKAKFVNDFLTSALTL